MFGSLRLRGLLTFAVLATATLLSGCVYAPYPAYGYNGGGYYGGGYYGAPYYGGGVVAFGSGWGWHDHGWHGWHDHDWR